jgi:hypothetical protein
MKVHRLTDVDALPFGHYAVGAVDVAADEVFEEVIAVEAPALGIGITSTSAGPWAVARRSASSSSDASVTRTPRAHGLNARA